MIAQRGRDFLLKVYDAPTTAFVTVAGLRRQSFALNTEPVDISSIDSQNQWRELLSGAGPKSAELTGSGVFKDSGADELVRAAFFGATHLNWQVCIPSFGVIEGPFQIRSLQYTATFAEELSFEIALQSAGALNFAPLVSG